MTTLFTDRLVLRPLQATDLDTLAVLHEEPSFWHYPLGRGQTRAETEEFFERVVGSYTSNGFGLEAVVERKNASMAGWAGLSVPNFLPEILPAVEVGWRLGTGFRGRGYATEAGAAWVRWGFEVLGLDEIVSIYEPDNSASGRVMAKLGFELARVTVHPMKGGPLHVTALTGPRWRQLCAAGKWPSTTSTTSTPTTPTTR
jgi:RimJ/RimL family protein N-acetyltransferase